MATNDADYGSSDDERPLASAAFQQQKKAEWVAPSVTLQPMASSSARTIGQSTVLDPRALSKDAVLHKRHTGGAAPLQTAPATMENEEGAVDVQALSEDPGWCSCVDRAEIMARAFRWGKGTRGGIMRQGLKEGDDDAHTMRTIRDTSRAAHGKVLSSDVFVPMTQPVVSDQPGSAMFVVHLPPVDPTKKPPCILSPPIVVAIPCCCCVGTFNVCARVMPALANLWSVFCVNQQRQCFSLDAMRSCCATDILLANSTFCCVCKSESDTLDTRRVIVTATHDTGVLQGGQVTIETYSKGKESKEIDASCCCLKACRITTGPTEEFLRAENFNLHDLKETVVSQTFQSNVGSEQCCLGQQCGCCCPYHCCHCMYFKNKKEFRNSTAVTLKLNGATSSIFSSDKVLEWQTHGTKSADALLNADVKYSIADTLKAPCEDKTSVARTFANVLHYLKQGH